MLNISRLSALVLGAFVCGNSVASEGLVDLLQISDDEAIYQVPDLSDISDDEGSFRVPSIEINTRETGPYRLEKEAQQKAAAGRVILFKFLKGTSKAETLNLAVSVTSKYDPDWSLLSDDPTPPAVRVTDHEVTISKDQDEVIFLLSDDAGEVRVNGQLLLANGQTVQLTKVALWEDVRHVTSYDWSDYYDTELNMESGF